MSEIISAIFAAGEGERFKKDFPYTPKPLIKIGDKTLIEYSLDNLLKLKPKSVGILLNLKTGPYVSNYLKNKNYSFKAVMLDSKTSFESFYTISNFMKEKNKTLIISTVDTILKFDELKNLLNNHIKTNSYITLGITPFINDEKPLLVEIDKFKIKSIGKTGNHATNGIYCLSYEAVNDIHPLKYSKLREFLSSIDFSKKDVSYYVIKESFDIDDISDIQIASEKLKSWKN